MLWNIPCTPAYDSLFRPDHAAAATTARKTLITKPSFVELARCTISPHSSLYPLFSLVYSQLEIRSLITDIIISSTTPAEIKFRAFVVSSPDPSQNPLFRPFVDSSTSRRRPQAELRSLDSVHNIETRSPRRSRFKGGCRPRVPCLALRI